MKITFKNKRSSNPKYEDSKYDDIVIRASDINEIKEKHNLLVDSSISTSNINSLISQWYNDSNNNTFKASNLKLEARGYWNLNDTRSYSIPHISQRDLTTVSIESPNFTYGLNTYYTILERKLIIKKSSANFDVRWVFDAALKEDTDGYNQSQTQVWLDNGRANAYLTTIHATVVGDTINLKQHTTSVYNNTENTGDLTGLSFSYFTKVLKITKE